MTIYTPTYRVTIAGTVQTSTTLEDATITYGRNDFFEATQPSYCNLELLNLDGTSPTVELLDTILIEVTNSAGTYVKLFTGEVSGVYNRFAGAGLGGKPNTLQIQAVGALGLLVKRYAGSVAYPEELDGARITRILEETLYIAWEDLSNTLTWNDLPVSETWANYGVQGIDTIDAGRYEVLARTAAIDQAYNLTDTTQQSALGYLYDTPDFTIGYADAERRSENYTTNLIELDANLVNADIQTRLQTADIVNSVVIQYDDPVLEVAAQNDTSINTYGLLEEVRSTILAQTADATEQATNFVNYRGTPKVSLEEVTVNLSNSDMTNTVRDNLLGVSMDTLLYLDNIPVGLIAEGYNEGFVEGWTWTLGRNNLELAMSVSNSIYSTLDVQWEDYNSAIQWQNLANDYRWLDVV
jgi:hypothetical protein